MAIDLKTIPCRHVSVLSDENNQQSGVRLNPLVVSVGAGLSAFGELAVSIPHPIFQYSFEYTVDNTDLLENETTGGGTVTQGNGMATVSASTVTTSTAKLQSASQARYQAGQGGLIRFTAKFPDGGVAGTEQYIGIMDEEGSSAAFKNGLCIGYDGVTFGAHRFQNDTKISIAQADWDDPLDGSGRSGMTYDATKLNVFEIRYQYLGAGAITFHIEDDATGAFIKFHTILYANTDTTPHIHNPNFHFIGWVNNGATTTNLRIATASCAYFVEGVTEEIHRQHPQNSSGLKTKTTVTTEIALLTIRNKALYAGKNNFIEIRLENLVASIESSSANNLGEVRLVRNATLGGTPSYADINTANSVVDFDVAATTVTGGKELLSIPLAGKNDKIDKDVTRFSIRLRHGQTITIAGSSENSATMKAGLLWEELF